MDYTVLEKSPLFTGIPAAELRELLEITPHHIYRNHGYEIFFANLLAVEE